MLPVLSECWQSTAIRIYTFYTFSEMPDGAGQVYVLSERNIVTDLTVLTLAKQDTLTQGQNVLESIKSARFERFVKNDM